jgi:hypothetical protein
MYGHEANPTDTQIRQFRADVRAGLVLLGTSKDTQFAKRDPIEYGP